MDGNFLSLMTSPVSLHISSAGGGGGADTCAGTDGGASTDRGVGGSTSGDADGGGNTGAGVGGGVIDVGNHRSRIMKRFAIQRCRDRTAWV
jgi:hypothetical protein